MDQGESSSLDAGNDLGVRHIEVELASPLSLDVQAGIKSNISTWINSLSPSDKFLLGRNGEIDLSSIPSQLQFPHVDQIVKIRILSDTADIGCSFSRSFPVGCPSIIHVFELSREEASVEEIEPSGGGDEWTAGCDSLPLPHASLDGLWENLIFDSKIKLQLLEFAQSSILFSEKMVSEHIINWNRILLLHGVPGTGKTSLCRALAHKLAIRLSHRFQRATLLEIHSHSLFSKWFSTSGKLVSALFSMVRDMVEDDPHSLVCVLIDEVESLASSRNNAGGDPSDSMRAVNSLLTSLDRLRSFPNVLVLATTNITGQIDDAFVDRVDLKLEIGLPILKARYEILRTCLEELIRVGIIGEQGMKNDVAWRSFEDTVGAKSSDDDETRDVSLVLLDCAKQAEGLSGRSLRRLPLQAHSQCSTLGGFDKVSVSLFLRALSSAIEREQSARLKL